MVKEDTFSPLVVAENKSIPIPLQLGKGENIVIVLFLSP
jgi:hypothetical protein